MKAFLAASIAVGLLSSCANSNVSPPKPPVVVLVLPPSCSNLMSTLDPVGKIAAKDKSLKEASRRYRILEMEIERLRQRSEIEDDVGQYAREDEDAADKLGNKALGADAKTVAALQDAKVDALQERILKKEAQQADAKDRADAWPAWKSEKTTFDINSSSTMEELNVVLIGARFGNENRFAQRELFCRYVLGEVADVDYPSQVQSAVTADIESYKRQHVNQ